MAKPFAAQRCMCTSTQLVVRFFYCPEHNDTFGLCEDCADLFEDPECRVDSDTLGAFLTLVAAWFEEHKSCSIRFGVDRLPTGLDMEIPINQYVPVPGKHSKMRLLKN